MTRLAFRTAQHVADLLVLSAALALSFLLRFDFDLPQQMLKRLLFLWPYVVLLEWVILTAAGVPKFAWRYVGLREASRILTATGVAAVILLVLRLLTGLWVGQVGWLQYGLLPMGVITANFGLAFLGVTGIRALRRLAFERAQRRRRGPAKSQVPTLLIGAGRAGLQVAKELASRPDLGIRAVGFVDDDPNKRGSMLHGIPVLGRSDDLTSLVHKYGAAQAVITIASASGATIRDLVKRCEAAGITAKIIPAIHEILDGRVNLSRIREVSIEDLLGRDAVHLEMDKVSAQVRDQVVLVTGAGGSIGSELCRQLVRHQPREIVLVERSEPALFQIFHELRHSSPVRPVLCDVTDAARVEAVFAQHRPHMVFHAAAHKHVHLMEWNPGEAIKNNVFGTRTVAEASARHGVATFVMVSTDKAVNPTSIMGATKRAAELSIQAIAADSDTRFVAVRFGNVLGSTGSVIPIFKDQIDRGGPVTVTHPAMKRYFMTIPEASQLVIQAGVMGRGGEIFVLDMGEPVLILDLARDLIKLSGLEPDRDIAIEFTGVRPGEKLFEEFAFDAERMDKTRHPKIYVGRITPLPTDKIRAGLTRLRGVADTNPDRAAAEAALRLLVPEMQRDAHDTPLPRAEAPATPAPVTPALG